MIWSTCLLQMLTKSVPTVMKLTYCVVELLTNIHSGPILSGGHISSIVGFINIVSLTYQAIFDGSCV